MLQGHCEQGYNVSLNFVIKQLEEKNLKREDLAADTADISS